MNTNELHDWQMFLAGDKSSFKILFERYSPLLFNYGHKFTKDEDLIEESIQQFFVKIWYNKDNLNDTISVKNYIFKSFRRILTKNLQVSIRRQGISLDSEQLLPFDIELPHEINLIRKERLEEISNKLRLALDKMTPRQREIIHLRFFDELSYNEIADIMGLSVKDTYKLHYRAIDSLKKYFDSFGLLILLYLAHHIKDI